MTPKFTLQVHPIETGYNVLQILILKDLSRLSAEWYGRLQPWVDKGHHLLIVQYATIVAVNGRPIPKDRVFRAPNHADVLVIRSEFTEDDFKVEFVPVGGIY